MAICDPRPDYSGTYYCGHTFTYNSVIPPSHCPTCGACLGCGQRTAPMYPRPYQPWPTYPHYGPFWYTTSPNITITSTTGTTE